MDITTRNLESKEYIILEYTIYYTIHETIVAGEKNNNTIIMDSRTTSCFIVGLAMYEIPFNCIKLAIPRNPFSGTCIDKDLCTLIG